MKLNRYTYDIIDASSSMYWNSKGHKEFKAGNYIRKFSDIFKHFKENKIIKGSEIVSEVIVDRTERYRVSKGDFKGFGGKK